MHGGATRGLVDIDEAHVEVERVAQHVILRAYELHHEQIEDDDEREWQEKTPEEHGHNNATRRPILAYVIKSFLKKYKLC